MRSFRVVPTEIRESNPDRRFLPVLEGELAVESIDAPLELPEAEPPAMPQVSFGAGRQRIEFGCWNSRAIVSGKLTHG